MANPTIRICIRHIEAILKRYNNNLMTSDDCFGQLHNEINKTMIDLCSKPQDIVMEHPVLKEADLVTRIEYDRGKIDIKEVAFRVKNAWRDRILAKAKEEAEEILKKENEK